jgi:hypothetical protein
MNTLKLNKVLENVKVRIWQKVSATVTEKVSVKVRNLVWSQVHDQARDRVVGRPLNQRHQVFGHVCMSISSQSMVKITSST